MAFLGVADLIHNQSRLPMDKPRKITDFRGHLSRSRQAIASMYHSSHMQGSEGPKNSMEIQQVN